ncbi:hypothetical protein UlMin_018358 [Ulmus minor]
MTEPQNSDRPPNLPSHPPSSNNGHVKTKVHYPNPPDAANPDPATLREQWKFAIRQYSKWYSHAWGTAILAGFSFFALGWIIKGSNPLPSLSRGDSSSPPSSDAADDSDRPRP